MYSATARTDFTQSVTNMDQPLLLLSSSRSTTTSTVGTTTTATATRPAAVVIVSTPTSLTTENYGSNKTLLHLHERKQQPQQQQSYYSRPQQPASTTDYSRNTIERKSNLHRSGYFRRSVRRLGTRWENWSGTPSFSMDEPSEVTKLIGVPAGADPKLWFFLIYATFFISGCHFLCGAVSIAVGAITTIAAEQTVYAHTVSPIWSGISFIAAGFCGISAARKRTVYMIHLFMGTAVCALFMSLISIQLLRLGLVYHTSDGNTYQKDAKDVWIILALSDAAAEAFFGLIGVFTSWKMARLANVPPEPVKDDGPFHIQITKGGSHYMTTNKYTNKRKISSL